MKLNRGIYAIIGVIVLVFAGVIYAWSVLASPIAAFFSDWTKAQLSLTFTICMVFFCLGGVLGGFLSRKFSARVILWTAGLMFLVGFYMTSVAQSLPVLYVGYGFLGGLASGLSYNRVLSTVLAWFPEKQGLLSGILLMGFGIGSFLIGKVYQAVTPGGADLEVWRTSFAVFAVILFIILFISGLLLKNPTADTVLPQAAEKKRGAGNAGEITEELTAGNMMKRPIFWVHFLWSFVLSAAGLALIAQASGLIVEVNPAAVGGTIATAAGIISIFNGIGRVIFGGLFDRIGYQKTKLLINATFIVAVVLLLFSISTKSFVLLVLGYMATGLGYGGVPPTNSAFSSLFFGRKNFPVNLSIVNLNLLFASFGGTVAGALFDSTQSYFTTLIFMAAAILIGCVASIRLKRNA
ncbi:MAG: MFS transporter [Lachnospiraceae bacterium]